MVVFEGKNLFQKLWYILRTYILVVKVFDLFLQGTFLVIILLRSNAVLLLRRDAGTGQLSSFLEDWVIMAVSGVEFVLGSAFAWIGGKRRNIAISGCLSATAFVSALVLAFPYQDDTRPSIELCSGESISAYSGLVKNITEYNTTDDLASYRIIILIITLIMCSLSTISVWSHGLTYLDDHDPHNGPFFYGILISIRLSLGLSGQNWLKDGALRNDWWEAHLSLSMLILMFAILFLLFPNKMPHWKHVHITDKTGFFASLLRVLRNKTLSLQILALSLLNAGVLGFVNLDAAYVQARFHIETLRNDPRTSRVVSDIFRALVVIFFVMIFRIRFSNRRGDGVKSNTAAKVGGVVALFVAVFFIVIAVLNCSTGSVAGMETGDWQQPQCSSECRCNPGSNGFTPVCVVDTGVTHFSPCSTGCYEYEVLNGPIALFHNCTCGLDQRVVRGSCSLPSCQAAFAAYQILYTVVIAVSAAALLMQGMVILRAVQRWDKPIAQGLTFSTITLLSNVPGHFLFMTISHFTCAYYGENGATCMFHRPTLFWAAVASSILAICSAITSLLSSKLNDQRVQPTSISNDVDLDNRN